TRPLRTPAHRRRHSHLTAHQHAPSPWFPTPRRPFSGRRPRAMKESILDVLLYLFEHYIADDADTLHDRDPRQADLLEAGSTPRNGAKAFDWLDGLAPQRPAAGHASVNGPVRVFHGRELDKIDVEARGFLLFLEQHGVLDAHRGELVVDRAMA